MRTKETQALAAKPTNEIIVYQPDETVRLEVALAGETVWLSIMQMCQLFDRERSVVAKHLKAALQEGELDVGINVQNLHKNHKGRPQAFYDLDAIISVGYRVKSLRGTQFRRWATKVLREHLLHGYTVNSKINQLEDKMDRRLAQHDADIGELKDKVDFFVKTSLPPVQGVFYDGQVFDARVFATKHILSAKKSILLIDSWVDVGTLEILAKKGDTVSVEIVTSPRGNKLAASDIAKFNAQYGGLTVRTSAKFHDRFLVIDDRRLYLIGASLKDLGWKCFAFTQLDAGEIAGLKARI